MCRQTFSHVHFALNTSNIYFEEECKLNGKKGRKKRKTTKTQQKVEAAKARTLGSYSKGVGKSIVLDTTDVQMLVKFGVKKHLTNIEYMNLFD